MKVFVSAAEISSDIHAEKILQTLSSLALSQGQKLEIAGIGGPRLRSLPGFQAIQNAEDMRAIGFVEILNKIYFLKRVMRKSLAFLETFQPDLILTFDYPDFHLRLMKQVHEDELLSRALKICAIPPKVWVWRAHRVQRLRKWYDGVLVIFPFEKEFYQSKGIPVISEGNPLIADLLAEAETQTQAEAQVKTDTLPSEKKEDIVLTVMPGSRDAELKYHLPLVGPTLELLAQKLKQKVKALVPVPRGIPVESLKSRLQNSGQVEYEFRVDGAISCLSTTSFGLIKSGTSTLEAAVLGCVPVIFYKTNKITEWIFRLFVRYPGPVGLPNILLGVKLRKNALFPEFLGPEATPENLAQGLYQLAIQTAGSEKRKQGEYLRHTLVPNAEVAKNIAARIWEWKKHPPIRTLVKKKRILIGFASTLWSLLNALRRQANRLLLQNPKTFSVPSVMFGNIQAGGSGKTPLLIEFAKQAMRRGKRVGVITRGYRGEKETDTSVLDAGEASISPVLYGDEAAEIKKQIPQCYLAVGANRIASVKAMLARAKEKNEALDLLLFDDGFQNLSFQASVNVVCVTDQERNQVVFRDFKSALRHADFIFGMKGNDFSEYQSLAPLVRVEWKARDLPLIPVWILCAVGSPEEVQSFYAAQGMTIYRMIAKPDHAAYAEEEVKILMKKAYEAGAMIAVTEKDAVKIESLGIRRVTEPLASLQKPLNDRILVLTRQLASPEVLNPIFERLHQ